MITSLIASLVSVKSCVIAQEQSERYFNQIKFNFKKQGDSLEIRQISGSRYYLGEIKIHPVFSLNPKDPFTEGVPYVADLHDDASSDEDIYIISDINKRLCLQQNIENCDQQNILMLSISYEINKKLFRTNVK